MTEEIGIIAQIQTTAPNNMEQYVVPYEVSEIIIKKMFVTNLNTIDITYNIYVTKNGEEINNRQIIIYNDLVRAIVGWKAIDLNIPLNSGDVIRFIASKERVNFNLFGVKIKR